MARILAFSSSRTGKSGYLETAAPVIKAFLGDKALNIAFIPFASVDTNYEKYTSKVTEALTGLPYTIRTVSPDNCIPLIEESDVIMTGGGNTFKLLHDVYRYRLTEAILHKVKTGTPYVGWSAGSNIAGASIGTTNDMPIIQPESFKALGLFPFQINPHYFNANIEGFHGETRDQRLEEFIRMNPGSRIVCLPEGTALELNDDVLIYSGPATGVLFYPADYPGAPFRREIQAGSDLSFLLSYGGK